MSAKADNRTSKALHFQCRVLSKEVYSTLSVGTTKNYA